MEEEGREGKETDFPCEIFANILNLGGKLASNTSVSKINRWETGTSQWNASIEQFLNDLKYVEDTKGENGKFLKIRKAF